MNTEGAGLIDRHPRLTTKTRGAASGNQAADMCGEFFFFFLYAFLFSQKCVPFLISHGGKANINITALVYFSASVKAMLARVANSVVREHELMFLMFS